MEVALETPTYDLTILRIEAMVHNTRDLRCRLGLLYFAEIAAALREMVERFVEDLDCLDTAFIDPGLLGRDGPLNEASPCRHFRILLTAADHEILGLLNRSTFGNGRQTVLPKKLT